ncbi:MAG: sulfurtransferase-like selenium metabolism protein YedF [Candidatus Obscuribacterales bacterium]|nr:sulfurtransferase-like selenium metabolism protein YedF [Candidatus Obscuribacterales bacterium]
MNEKLDLRGKLCPEPVIATKKVLDKKEVESIEALVDDEICVANLERLARSQKVHISVKKESGFYAVSLSRNLQTQADANIAGLPEAGQGAPDNSKTGTVLFITRETLGEGDAEFGKTLLGVFLQSMYESGHKPRAILLSNSGVKLLSSSSSSKKVLEDFKAGGSEVLACGLCVEFYGLKAEIATEQITNMFAICEYLNAADKLIQP